MNRLLFLASLLQLLSGQPVSFSQVNPLGRIFGQVVDDSTGEPLAFVNVRVDGTTLGSVSKEDGRFEIFSVPIGMRTVFASRLGYKLASQRVLVTNSGTALALLRLEPKPIEVAPTEITGNRSQWRTNYSRFVKLLLGNTPNGSDCKILNPEVISFAPTSPGALTATSEQPIHIENRALG